MKIKLVQFTLFYLVSNFVVYCQTTPDLGKLDNAVVLIKIYDDNGKKIGHGSGFCIDPKGIIVTNYHVVENAYTLEVYFESGKQFLVENIVSGSEEIDLVKLQLEIPDTLSLPFLALAKELPSKGERCWSIGTPAEEAYFNTVASGDVSNLYVNSSPVLIQTNAKIAHGSSGGALVNSQGEVIGVTTFGDVSEDGTRADINFAVWIGELEKLSPINQKTLVIIEETPYCDISFYTRDKFNDQVYIYVDGQYAGELEMYFFPDAKVTCFMEGTISVRLPAGTHTYAVHWAQNNTWAKGQVTLAEGACKLYEILAPAKEPQTNNPNPTWNSPYSETPAYTEVTQRNWAVGIGVPLVIKFTAARYSRGHRWAIRGGLTILTKALFTYPHLGVDLDFLRIWRNSKIFRPYIYLAPMYEYLVYSNKIEKNWYFGPGAGFETNFGRKIFIYFDVNMLFGLNETADGVLNGNLGLGFRF
jgi:hypothetical protein